MTRPVFCHNAPSRAHDGSHQRARATAHATDVADHRAPTAEPGRIRRRVAGRAHPAMAGIGAVRLWDEECLVEVDGTAVLG